MPGSIRRRGADSWQLRVYAGIDASSGRERWITRTVRGSETKARRELEAFTQEAEYARIHAGSVSELLDAWFSVASPDWAPTTIAGTRSIVERHLKPNLGHVPVVKLTTADIDAFYADLRHWGGPDGRPLSPGTVHRVHVVLHRALAQAVRWEWIWLNPATNASPPRYVPTEIRPPSAEEVSALIDAAKALHPNVGTFFLLAATTGARRGELLALRWRDIDLDEGSIAFQRAVVEGPEGPVLTATKTRRSHRVALDGESVEALRSVYKRAAEISLQSARPDSFVFTSRKDAMLSWLPNWVTKVFIRCRETAGLPHFRLHDLRHFMATEMLQAGVPISVVSARLAHARASTTLNVYAHAIPGGDRTAAEQLAARLRLQGRDGSHPLPAVGQQP